MKRTLCLAVSGTEAGKSAIAVGLLAAMRRRAGRVGSFRPVVVRGAPRTPLLSLLGDTDASYGVTYDDLHADPERALGTIVDRFRAAQPGYEAMLVVGTDFTDVGVSTELSFNARVAVELGAPVLLVVSGRNRTPAETVDAAVVGERSLHEQRCQVLGVVVNRVADVAATGAALADVIVGAVLAHQAQTFPRLSGVLLTGGLDPDPPVRRLVESLALTLPIAVM